MDLNMCHSNTLLLKWKLECFMPIIARMSKQNMKCYTILVQEKRQFLKDFLMNIMVDNKRIFLGVKQGTGKHKNDTIVIIDPKQKVDTNI